MLTSSAIAADAMSLSAIVGNLVHFPIYQFISNFVRLR